MIKLQTFTVSEVNRKIKTMFDSELMFQSILISGEISNFSEHYKTGHLYFTLKDSSAAIKAVMFSRQAVRLKFTPENGMKVICLGRLGVFERDGVYQIYVDDIQPDGAGSLAVAFEQLRKRLEKEGLFSEAHKKSLPAFPQRIGVITSPTGAAVRDIFNILGRRYPIADIIFKGVSVQGTNAAPEMIAAIKEFDRKKCADVIIIGRGGGSTEDLWAFNDELLARTIYECSIPVISAVGHETDFTICDFVSDMRAPTPSAGAELAVPDINNLSMTVASYTDSLYSYMNNYIANERKKLNLILGTRSFTSPGDFFAPEHDTIEKLTLRLKTSAEKLLANEKNILTGATTALEKLNPLSVLLRGYSLVAKDNEIIESVDKINPGDNLNISMSDGNFSCEVISIGRK